MVIAAAAAAEQASLTLSSFSSDSVNCSQFVQLLDLFLADTTNDELIRQVRTFICEGFVQSKDERTVRRQQVTAGFSREFSLLPDSSFVAIVVRV